MEKRKYYNTILINPFITVNVWYKRGHKRGALVGDPYTHGGLGLITESFLEEVIWDSFFGTPNNSRRD